MDNSHVALVSVKFSAAAFKRYRCDRPMPLGVNLTSLNKVLKCAKDDDICTLRLLTRLTCSTSCMRPKVRSSSISSLLTRF